ncbi:MAG: hypothetical protein Q8L55_03010, partial [Phycisphaerales bacterium]|nr:hypothetical protein [Phycisphaerales bacterium]
SASGSSGIVAGFYSAVSDCTATGSTFSGVAANTGSVITRCTAQGNGTTGISSGTAVSHCVATGNGGDGISGQGTVTACVANGNVTGIRGGVGAVIFGCTASGNSATGISVNDGGSIIDCAAMNNVSSNIVCADGCLVRGCNAFANNVFPSVANIVATGGENRLEHNNATGATRGFDVNGAGNFLSGNTARNNTTNYSVVAGNICYVLAATTSAAINGSSGGVSPGTTSAWVNYSF